MTAPTVAAHKTPPDAYGPEFAGTVAAILALNPDQVVDVRAALAAARRTNPTAYDAAFYRVDGALGLFDLYDTPPSWKGFLDPRPEETLRHWLDQVDAVLDGLGDVGVAVVARHLNLIAETDYQQLAAWWFADLPDPAHRVGHAS